LCVVVAGLLVVCLAVEPPPLPPQPATAKLLARTVAAASMAVSGFLLIGRAPVVIDARGFGRPPYQALAAANAASQSNKRGPARRLEAGRAALRRALVSVETKAGPQAVEPATADGRGSRSTWLLVVCCVAQFMVILDLSIVNVALPSIQSSLGFSAPELQWIVDAYSITFAGFLMLGGRAADHFGQRRMFVIALLLFGLASLAGGLAPDRGLLVVARAAQGLGGALMAACSLAIITSSFAPGPQLHRAIGAWASMNGLGGAAGMLFGGLITEFLSWRWVLLINPPIGIAAAIVAYAVVSERRRAPGRSFDLAGALTLTIGQIVLVFGIVEAGLAGLDTFAALGPIVAGLVLLAVFGVIEVRFASEPLIPFKELTKPLRIANNIVLLFSASLFPLWFVSSLYLQQVLYLSPLDTGLIFLPMTLTIMLVASRTGKLVSHFGVRPVLGGGLVMLTAGLLLLAKIGSSGSPVVYIMIPGLLVAAGIAMSIVPSTIAATQGAKEGQAGLASGLVNTSRQVGGGLGLAVLVTLATSRSSHLIGAGHGVAQSLTDGFRLAYLIGGGLAAAAALVTFTALRNPAGVALPAARRLAIAVVVVVAGFLALDTAFAGSHGAPVGAYTTRGAYSFVTAPSLHPPILHRSSSASATAQLAPGYIFTTNFYNLNYPPLVGQSGPLILDDKLQPVWFQPVPERLVASNLSLESYAGKPALAWWQGVVTSTGSTESGEDVLVNQHYQTVARIRGKHGWKLTLHAIDVSGEDIWVTANKNIAKNLSGYGGAYNGAMIDSAVQEYDIKTGKLLFNWDALDHIPLGDSRATVPTNGFPWDAYHVNAIDLTGSGSFLVSMRNTWAAYMVNIKTGRIEWTLGGKHSSFSFGPGAEFQWQHDVALGAGGHDGPTITVFDDHCCQLTGGGTSVEPTGPSRGLVLELNRSTHVATLEAQYGDREGFKSEYMGDTQPLQNSNTFVGWGSAPYFTEYGPSGKLLLEGSFPGSDLSYRSMVEQWVGLPLSSPAGAARERNGRITAYASWNGATQVVSWRLLASLGASHQLAAATTVPRSGFETAIPVPSDYQSYQVQALKRGKVVESSAPVIESYEVQALDASGRVIGSSPLFSATAQ
jgi:EmrB/QacA subfamily drug resistance transporter